MSEVELRWDQWVSRGHPRDFASVDTRRFARRAAVAALALLAACTAGSGGSATPRSAGPTEAGTSTTPATDESTAPDATRVTRPLAVAERDPPPGWALVAELPYGDADAELGVADTHGGQTAAVGPEYAAPDGNGDWWVLDGNKHRVARFDHGGRWLDAVAIPGRFTEFQLPFVIGTRFWASGGSGQALLADASSARRVAVGGSWPYSDGTRLYDAGGTRVLDPSVTLTPARTDALRTPAGTRFRAQLAPGEGTGIEVSLPDTRRLVTVDLIAAGGGQPDVIGFEVQADISGRLLFFVYGSAHGEQLAGFLTIDAATGAVSEMEPMRNPFSASDPGSPSHLRVIPGTTSAAVVFVDTDALRIYQRDWPERPRR